MNLRRSALSEFRLSRSVKDVSAGVMIAESTMLQNKRLLYDLLFRTSVATLLESARDPKHLGADIGLLSVLHTWGQNSSTIRMYTASCQAVASPSMAP